MAIKKPQINQFSSYFEIITIDLSKFNIDYDVEFDNVQSIQANIKTLYKFMNYDFDELEDFYTYKSFISLVHKITDFYENMKEKSHELESEDYFIFIEQEINKSIKGSKRHAIHSIEGFLNDL